MPTTATPVAPGTSAPAPTARRAALVAATGYLALFLLGVGANLVVLERLVVDGDPAATVAAIAADTALFRVGAAAFVAIAVVDVVVARALHALLRDVDRRRSALAAWARIGYSLVLAAGTVQLLRVDRLVAQAGASADPVAVTTALDSFTTTWMVGLALFGVHLVLLAGLLASRGAPAPLGWLLRAAGAAYVLDTLRHLVLPDGGPVTAVLLAVVVVTSMGGEGWLTGWLFLRGGREAHRG